MLITAMSDPDTVETDPNKRSSGHDGEPLARRGGKAKPLGQHVGKLTKRAFGRRGFADGVIIANWKSVIGDHLAELSEPERITYPQGKRSGGTLHLRIASGSIAVELQHLEPLLIERINGHFGYKAVDKVRLIQAPLEKRPDSRKKIPRTPLNEENAREVAGMLSDVEDSELHESLERLARAMLSRPKA